MKIGSREYHHSIRNRKLSLRSGFQLIQNILEYKHLILKRIPWYSTFKARIPSAANKEILQINIYVDLSSVKPHKISKDLYPMYKSIPDRLVILFLRSDPSK